MDSAGNSEIHNGLQTRNDFLQPTSNNTNSTWDRVKNDIKNSLGNRTFNAWIAQLILVEEQEMSVTLIAPSEFVRDRIRNDYLKDIKLHWMRHDINKRSLRVEASTDMPESISQHNTINSIHPQHSNSQQYNSNTNTKVSLTRSFDTLVEGNSNELAVGIAKRLANGDAGPVSVVLFHGPNGVGKTHLLESIKDKRNQKLGIGTHTVMMGAEELMLTFVEGVKRKDTSALRQKMRNTAILLLDDIHLLKRGTLREFFSHLRAITSKGGRVVMTSDSSADRLEFLDARMRDDMNGGVSVRINPPDLRMRADIVRVKTQLIAQDFPEFTLNEQWIQLLANSLPPSGRAIDGAVRTIFAATILVDKPVCENAVQTALGNENKHKKTRIETIKDVVAANYGITRADIESSRRNRSISLPRQIAMYIARQATTCSYPQIGRIFGGRDHTTVIYACSKIADKIKSDDNFAQLVEKLRQNCVNHPDNRKLNKFSLHSWKN